jgi:hypothetical protein
MQSTITLTVAESEYYALVRGGAHALSIKTLLEDWGLRDQKTEIMLKLKSDCAAAKSMGSRKGLGTQRHVNTRYLWPQDRVACGDLTIDKVPSEAQLADPADPLTKAMISSSRDDLISATGFYFSD